MRTPLLDVGGGDLREISDFTIAISPDTQQGALGDAGDVALELFFTDDTRGIFSARLSPVPEPGSAPMGLVALGLVAILRVVGLGSARLPSTGWLEERDESRASRPGRCTIRSWSPSPPSYAPRSASPAPSTYRPTSSAPASCAPALFLSTWTRTRRSTSGPAR